MHVLHADIHLLILFPIFCPTSPKKENNMRNWKMVLSEGFKDIWNLVYFLKVNFSSNYVIIVKLLGNVKHKINILPDRKWQKTLSCVCVWVSEYVCECICCMRWSSRAPPIHQNSFHKFKEHWYTLHMYKTSPDIEDNCTEHRLIFLAPERDLLL